LESTLPGFIPPLPKPKKENGDDCVDVVSVEVDGGVEVEGEGRNRAGPHRQSFAIEENQKIWEEKNI
jgi:hypothetical protein